MDEVAREKDGRDTAAPAHQVKTEKQFEVTFRVTGGFEILRTLNQYMKENGIAYTVLEQKKDIRLVLPRFSLPERGDFILEV